MRLQPGQKAPAIRMPDHAGDLFDLDAIERPTMLQFHRYVGCPVCHLHVHDYLDVAAQWKARGVDVVVIYYSSKEEVINTGRFSTRGLPIRFICDPGKQLYERYGVESSLLGTLSPLAWKDGALALLKGHSFLRAFPLHGLGGLPADFLVDTDGIIRKARYGRAINDSLPVRQFFKWIDELQGAQAY